MSLLSTPDCRAALNRSTPIPLWAQVEDYLASAIADGQLRPGDTLAPEIALADQFKVSRAVIRQALGRLDEKGLITRHRGIGTRVAVAAHRPPAADSTRQPAVIQR